MKNLTLIRLLVPIALDANGNTFSWMHGKVYSSASDHVPGICVGVFPPTRNPSDTGSRECLVLRVTDVIYAACSDDGSPEVREGVPLVFCEPPRGPARTLMLVQNRPSALFSRLRDEYGMETVPAGSLLAEAVHQLRPGARFPAAG